MKNKKITAFGKKVTRAKAYQIIINDMICNFVHSQNTEELKDILLNGWKSLELWTDGELADFILNLCIDNQPRGKI